MQRKRCFDSEDEEYYCFKVQKKSQCFTEQKYISFENKNKKENKIEKKSEPEYSSEDSEDKDEIDEDDEIGQDSDDDNASEDYEDSINSETDDDKQQIEGEPDEYSHENKDYFYDIFKTKLPIQKKILYETKENDSNGDSEAETQSETSVSDENEYSEDEYEDDSEEEIVFDKEQTKVLRYVRKLIADKDFQKSNPKIILLLGPAGTGKTEILKSIKDEYHDKVLCTASSGVAAMNFDGGRTAHSMFGLPFVISTEYRGVKSVAQRDYNINDYCQQVSGASCIVFDAVNMTDIRLIKIFNESLKHLMRTDEDFGGKIIIFGADFLELPPIGPCEQDSNSFSVKLSSFFTELNIKLFTLKKPYRNKGDVDLYHFITNLGSGKFPEIRLFFDSYIKLEMFKHTTKIEGLIDFVYPDKILKNSDLCAKRVILASTMRRAYEINEKIVEIFENKVEICDCQDNIFDNELYDKYVEQMDAMHEDTVVPEADLKLWKGCLCMVVRNMYQTAPGFYKTLLNGAKVIIEDIQPNIIWVREPGCPNKIPIERKIFKGRLLGRYFSRKQFPLRLCYATTIHKTQGQSLEKVGLDLTEPVFGHGQLYLALSRVRYRQDLKICVPEEQIHDGVAYATNVVDRRLVIKKYRE